MVILDSGSSEIAIPTKMMKALSDSGVPFDKYRKKCKNSRVYGDMEFIIGGDSYPLTNKEWMLRAKNNTQSLAETEESVVGE